MKDLSRYSEKDKSAVIGVGLKTNSKDDVNVKTPQGPEASKVIEESATVKNSEVSLNDYFAQKMAKFYAKKTFMAEVKVEVETETVVEEVESVQKQLKAQKKAMKKVKEAEAPIVEIQEEEQEEGVEERLRRKAERKERKRKEKEAKAAAEEEE